eukprot:7385731-Prymnesium_polylepis.3
MDHALVADGVERAGEHELQQRGGVRELHAAAARQVGEAHEEPRRARGERAAARPDGEDRHAEAGHLASDRERVLAVRVAVGERVAALIDAVWAGVTHQHDLLRRRRPPVEAQRLEQPGRQRLGRVAAAAGALRPHVVERLPLVARERVDLGDKVLALVVVAVRDEREAHVDPLLRQRVDERHDVLLARLDRRAHWRSREWTCGARCGWRSDGATLVHRFGRVAGKPLFEPRLCLLEPVQSRQKTRSSCDSFAATARISSFP